MAVISGNSWPSCLAMAQHLDKENQKKNSTILKIKVWGFSPAQLNKKPTKHCSVDKAADWLKALNSSYCWGLGSASATSRLLNRALCGGNVIFNSRCLK